MTYISMSATILRSSNGPKWIVEPRILGNRQAQLEQLALAQHPPLSPLDLSLELLLAAEPQQNQAKPPRHQHDLGDPPQDD